MCIGYASRPHLSPRLTRSGRTFILNPQSFGLYDSHINLATHSGILTSMQSTSAFALTSSRIQRSPTICSYSSHTQIQPERNLAPLCVAIVSSSFSLPECMKNNCKSQASVYDLAPLNFRRRATRPVSYYALF